MEELLNKVNEMINNSNKIPEDIKNIVCAICKGYIRESNGKISLDGIQGVCDSSFVRIDENNNSFSGINKIMALTTTNYTKEGKAIHKMEYTSFSDYVKFITMLTHELGHVITNYDTFKADDNGIYPIIKKTSSIIVKSKYDEEGYLMATQQFGYKTTEGFMEHISAKIFESKEFRDELKTFGYDLGDYIYKDERLFPSRIYDDFRAGFELYDYIMDGKLFDFSCKKYDDINNLIQDIKRYRIILDVLEKSGDSLWDLKKYEGQESSEEFEKRLKEYKFNKEVSVGIADKFMDKYNKDKDDPRYQELLDTYSKTLNKQKLLPIVEKEYK